MYKEFCKYFVLILKTSEDCSQISPFPVVSPVAQTVNLPAMQKTWVRSLGVGNGNPLQYSCLENSMDRGAWWATVHGVAKSQRGLSD